MPVDGLRDVAAGRPIEEVVIAELMRHFGVSFSALLYRLASRSVGLLSARARDAWLQKSVSPVLHSANDPAPEAAQAGYQKGRVGIGTLAALADEDAEQLFARLSANGVRPPAPTDGDLHHVSIQPVNARAHRCHYQRRRSRCG
ncbi:MAG TPA: hypothetical protein VIV12_12530 [Streptosporangiaceae bacterium]